MWISTLDTWDAEMNDGIGIGWYASVYKVSQSPCACACHEGTSVRLSHANERPHALATKLASSAFSIHAVVVAQKCLGASRRN